MLQAEGDKAEGRRDNWSKVEAGSGPPDPHTRLTHNQGMTPLHHAVLADKPETERMLEHLIALGADMRRKNRYGESARDWMLEHSEHKKMIRE